MKIFVSKFFFVLKNKKFKIQIFFQAFPLTCYTHKFLTHFVFWVQKNIQTNEKMPRRRFSVCLFVCFLYINFSKKNQNHNKSNNNSNSTMQKLIHFLDFFSCVPLFVCLFCNRKKKQDKNTGKKTNQRCFNYSLHILLKHICFFCKQNRFQMNKENKQRIFVTIWILWSWMKMRDFFDVECVDIVHHIISFFLWLKRVLFSQCYSGLFSLSVMMMISFFLCVSECLWLLTDSFGDLFSLYIFFFVYDFRCFWMFLFFW